MIFSRGRPYSIAAVIMSVAAISARSSAVAGNPAAAIGKRFDESVVEALLKLRWWDWPPEKIRRHVKLLCSERVDDLLKVGPD